MVIKLVRTDCTEPCKIQLLPGEHIIGRGKLLDCDDKRISRNHGQLQAYDDCLKLNALSQNPCFYMKKGIYETQILRKDCSVTLANGDKFGLLPDTFWYEVIYYSDSDIDRIHTDVSENNTEEYKTDEKCNQGEATKATDSTTPLVDQNETINGAERSESPSVIGNENSEILSNESEANKSENKQSNEDNADSVCSTSKPLEDCNNKESHELSTNDQVQVKRSHSLDEAEDVKKIKIEPEEVKTEPEEVKSELNDVKPGPSLNQVQDNANNGMNMPDPNAPVPKVPDPNAPVPNVQAPNIPQPPSRERCMYGASCYRKNPVHLSQFCHPRDDDWGDGAQKECPYGAACGKRDPRHLRDHSHPPAHRPHPPAGKRRRKRARDVSPGNDSGLMVNGKRVRKVLQRDNNYSESESEEDPYGTDESEDWQPETGESQEYSEDIL